MSRRSGRRRPAALAVALALLLASAGTASAAPDDVTFEGEGMTVSPAGAGGDTWDNGATGSTGNWAKQLWANGTASKTVTTTRSSVHLFARVKPSTCEGAPEITIKAGGKQWWSGPVNGDVAAPVTGEKFRYIGAMISLPPGTHTVEIAFTNNFDRVVANQKICDRAVLIDKVTLVATPFSPNGWRNKPLPSNAPIASNSTVLRNEIIDQMNDHMASGGAGVWIGHTSWATPVYTVPPDQPTVKVTPDRDNPPLAAQWAAVPLPPDARPQVGSDGSPESDRILVVWQPSTDTLWEFIGLRKDATGNWIGYFGGKMPNVSQHQGQFEDPPLGPGSGYGGAATSISYLAGVQRIEEIRRGVEGIKAGQNAATLNAIDHAINYVVMAPRGRAGWCWPAQRTDGAATALNPEAIPAGTRFRFPATLDLDQYNLHPHARLIAEAIKRYGMIATDQGGNFGFGAEDPFQTGTNPYPGFWDNRYPNYSGEFANFPWDQLQALGPEGTGCQDKP